MLNLKNNFMEEVLKKIDQSVSAFISAADLHGFQKAYLVASKINELRTLLTDAYMKPIMALQGSRLGFKTDKDKTGGYQMEVVRNCLIEAVLMGLQPTGNQFNIIAGNTYATKEGCGELLKKIGGLTYDIVIGLPRINADKSGAAVDATITWTVSGKIDATGKAYMPYSREKVVPIPVKIDQYATVDAINGKATRKARAWLLATITGSEMPEGEAQDIEGTVVSSRITGADIDKVEERIDTLLADCKNSMEVDDLQVKNPSVPIAKFIERKRQLADGK
jgi:hypothetical protein